MSPAEVWCLIAAIVGGAATIFQLAASPPPSLGGIGNALTAAAIALIAVALLIAL